MGKAMPSDKPTRRTVETLLRDILRNDIANPDYLEYQRLADEVQELTQRLINVPAVTKLERQRDSAYKRYRARQRKMAEFARRVRQQYLAEGMTPKVLKAVRGLVTAANRK